MREGVRCKLALWVGLLRSVVKLVLVGMVDRRIWRIRVKACHRCPIYDPVMKRCRPRNGSKLGCGCYVPYLAMEVRPYKGYPGCWARQFQGAVSLESYGWE
jgi:hypothetical protein